MRNGWIKERVDKEHDVKKEHEVEEGKWMDGLNK